jgi:iron complex transport system permease protein
MLTAKRLAIEVFIGLIILVLVMAACSMIGTQWLSVHRIIEGPGPVPGSNTDYEIFYNVRLPRVLLAALVGAGLAGSGVVLQAILRNPLAEPFILGISSGAGLGAIIAVLSGVSLTLWGGSPIAACAFIGALATVCLVWLVGRWASKNEITTLLLAGVVVNAFVSAVIMFLTSIIKSDQLQATILWLMGNVTETNLVVIAAHAIIIIAGLAALAAMGVELNVLSFGEVQARGLGINPARVKLMGFGIAAIITAVAVSLSGLIGFIGLIVPHAVRLLFGPDHRRLLPLSALTGAVGLVIADTVARTIVSPAQLPVGVITAMAGGPFFLFLLARYSRRVSWLAK